MDSHEIEKQLHLLLIPLMAQSHIIPITDFGKLLAQRGVIVSIITTPLNHERYKASIEHAVEAGMKIQMIPLQFPCEEAGLPQGCENMDSLSSLDQAREFFSACEMLKTPLENQIQEMDPKPSCIVSTNATPWTRHVATKFEVPRYVFETVSCFTLFCSLKVSQAQEQGALFGDSGTFTVPDMPHEIEFTQSQLPDMMRQSSSNSLNTFMDQIREARDSARGTLVNTFHELDPWCFQGYKKETEVKNLWCIGPVSLCNKTLSEKSDRGNKPSIDERYCLSWLDQRKPRSVIYVCFGSMCRVSLSQIKEIGLGLEASRSAFIWIIRGLDASSEVEKWLMDENFEERTKDKGLIIRGWAPQVLILSHSSIGGFLTHCGWNSTLEGVCAGVPMITWPMFAEQFYNEKFIVDILRIGVKVGVEIGVKPGSDQDPKAFVERDRIKKCVDELMMGEEDEERRIRALKLSEMARKAFEDEEDGSSYMNLTLLIQDVMQQVGSSC